jgi:DNA-binding LacI/PurR family transcriptional regulator
MAKTVTFQDVAKAAGVSAATVSRVVRGNIPVSPELEARVRGSALKLGLDLSGQSKARIAGFLLGNRRMLHPFHSRVLLGAEEYFAAHAYNLMFVSLQYDPKADLQDLHMPPLLQRRGLVCGYIMAARIAPNLLDFLKHRGIPSVVLGNHVLGEWRDADYDVVWFDDVNGVHEETRYLISLGHHHIWFIGNCRLGWGTRRFGGYRRAMTEAGIPPRLSEIRSDDYFEVGYLCTRSILNSGEPCSAIIAASDSIAQGAYKALADSGLQIPQDVSVGGFDDIEASLMQPGLTTVRAFPEQIGAQLAEMLLNRIANPALAPQRYNMPTRLIKRESHRSVSTNAPQEREVEAHAQDSKWNP